jgi:hypothetical protein
MNQFIIILSTAITALYQVNQMQLTLSALPDIISWTCDLEDEDKVLRIVTTEDISFIVMTELKKAGINSGIMQVFETG